jgi:hypothetical protein
VTINEFLRSYPGKATSCLALGVAVLVIPHFLYLGIAGVLFVHCIAYLVLEFRRIDSLEKERAERRKTKARLISVGGVPATRRQQGRWS